MVDVEVAPWIKGLPVAPEYRPSEAEFVDPVSFVLRIEEEAGQYGICKIVPPTAKPPRKAILANLHHSIAAAQAPASGKRQVSIDRWDANSLSKAKFSTRKQELGNGAPCQSHHTKGGNYSVEQFELKAKAFSKGIVGTSRDVVPVVLETLFWKTAQEDRVTNVELADNIPGSAFPENASEHGDGKKKKKKPAVDREAWKLVNGAWNMRYMAKLQGSMVRFMQDVVQGVTSPVLYIAMLFSHWSWTKDKHDLHFVEHLHMGGPKTWYVVPKAAALAFEDVVKNQDQNSILSPESLVLNGVPCCRLVQNPGEYVILFPRAHHFSLTHSFTCGERSSLATPGWLKAAKQAAARKELLSYPPIVCHEKLLYQTAMAFAKSSHAQDIRSSRLKHKMKAGAEEAVRTEFVNDVVKSQQVLEKLVRVARARSIMLKGGASTAAAHSEKENLCNLVNLDTIDSISLLSFVCETMEGADSKVDGDKPSDKSSPLLPIDWGSVFCSVCGIFCYACVVILQPTCKASENIRAGRIGVTDADDTHQENQNGWPGKTDRKMASYNVQGNGVKLDNLLPPCIMCPEHALQVFLLLRGCGNSRLLVVCHPDYETFDRNAKDFAKEMGMQCHFKYMVYDEENEQDLQLISAAIDAAEKRETGWIVRVSSRLPAVSLSEDSSGETDEDDDMAMDKASKEKKVVGRWCGRVWRYDQTHASLGGCRAAPKVAYNQDDAEGKPSRKRKAYSDETAASNDDYASLGKNCRKKKRTQMVAVSRADIEPPRQIVPCETFVTDVKAENVTPQQLVHDEMKMTEPGQADSSSEGRRLRSRCKEETETDVKSEMLTPPSENIRQSSLRLEESDAAALKDTPPQKNQQKCKLPKPLASTEAPSPAVISSNNGHNACGSTPCFSNCVWHDVPIVFSPTFRSSFMDTKPNKRPTALRNPSDTGIPRRRTRANSSLVDGPGDGEDENEEDKDGTQLTDEDEAEEEEQNDSDRSASSVEYRELAVDEAADDAINSRSKRTKRKSWKALAAEDELEATVKKGAKPTARNTGSETTKQKLAPSAMLSQGRHVCDFDGCTMSFRTANELALHKRNICTIKECSKQLCSHSYLMQHYRVHADDRPLKCPWKGCKKTFKWSWARTEHIRVHTGERPYTCSDCGKSYRFVSDFSRHKRTTGHSS